MKSKSVSQDRKRVSSEKYELDYAAKQLAGSKGNKQRAKKAVVNAKKALGRKTSRKAVMARARTSK